MPPPNDEPLQPGVTPIGRSIDVLRRQFGLGRVDHLVTLTERWPDLAGPGVGAASTVVDLRNGTVTVETNDPAVAEVLAWSKQRVLAAARELCPGERIVDLSVRVRPSKVRGEA